MLFAIISFLNWKVCEFYVTDGNDYDGSLRDRKPNGPFLKLEQSDTDKKPVVGANGHAGNSYWVFYSGECLTVDYNLNNREYISIFIVYVLRIQVSTFNGLWEMKMVVMIGILLFIIKVELKNYSWLVETV